MRIRIQKNKFPNTVIWTQIYCVRYGGIRTVGSIESGDPDTDLKFFYRFRILSPVAWIQGGKSESKSGYTCLFLAYVRSEDRINSPEAKFVAPDWVV
jgi:hypothetical protein